ncbi:hypothetical protein SBOR_1734 [Sclerotinia borealis F-4128]|uniref:Phenazine biosynthesis-like protein n=1 Tax=Sclerotinia borealis (strain F-4128) TaxID=1432307 RepID=W9CPA7_SCLBF|nr:hypothetical protein SBOR_1734 [Sclerotinia borealis F-4128]
MHIPFTNLDVFTHTRYLGNALAIIRPPTPITLSQTQKLQISKEFNLSEVVFLHLPESESPDTNPKELTIDIFTSAAEIPFAGHPTIGTAFFVLNYLGLKSVDTLITKAGRIPISLSSDGKIACAQIPHNVHVHDKTYSFKDFATGEETQYPVVSIVNGMTFVLVHLPSLADLARAVEIKNLNPSTYNVENLDEGWRNGLCTTMYYVGMGVELDEQGRRRYRTRMFGTREDSGTGSASCALACYLAMKDKGIGGKEVRFGFEQGVEMGKKNEIFVDVKTKGDGVGVERVVLSGEAVKVMEGMLEV